ncbi:hypothetical protein D0Z03_001334 [Geotrichum reessii]|nr:hypothetical protein D0Z03_001334 [Galactomyces reessii]
MKLSTLGFLAAASSVFAAPIPVDVAGVQLQNPFGSSGLSSTDKPIPGDSPLLLCDLEEPKRIEITAVNLDPNPPLKGKELKIFAEGIVKDTILEGAYIDIDVRYGYIRLLKQTFDLCEQTKTVGHECPIEEGKLELETSVDLPAEIPPGVYTVVARAYTVDDEPITCLATTVEFPAL